MVFSYVVSSLSKFLGASQVDLSREAAHLSRFIYNFRSWKDVSFPKPLYPLVHPAVLVESYEQGESVARFVDRPGKTRLNSELASIGTNTLLKMMLVHFCTHFHAFKHHSSEPKLTLIVLCLLFGCHLQCLSAVLVRGIDCVGWRVRLLLKKLVLWLLKKLELGLCCMASI